jgi:threonine/homoserine/homoserine lactone efflux protein
LNFGYTRAGQFALFFVSLLATVLLTDILKAYLADKLRRLLTPQSLRITNILLGITLICFGCRLIWHAGFL